MDSRGRALGRTAINRGQNLSPGNQLQLVRLGSDAFDAIADELRAGLFTPQQQVNALWALNVICGEGAPDRKSDLVAIALRLASSKSRKVRSRAVHTAISQTRILEILAKPSPRTQVRAVVEEAARRGLEPSSMVGFVDRFIEG